MTLKEHIELFYDDDMCLMLDSEVKPSVMRASLLNELSAKRASPRIVQWDPLKRRAVSI